MQDPIRLRLTLLLLVPLFLAAGCGEESQPTRPADPVPVRMVISPPSGQLTSIGQILRLNATLFDAGGNTLTGLSITWSSSNSAVASVSNEGVVVARSEGTAQITAAVGGLRSTITVTVERSPSRIVVTPESVRLTAKEETLLLNAVVLDASDTPIPDVQVNWSSASPAVASVNTRGLVTAHANGEARITATSGSVSRTIVVTVDIPTNRLVVSPESVNMASIGETVQLSARVLDASDMEIPDPDFTWNSEDPAVASVDDRGVVTARINGQTPVTVSWEDLSVSVIVTVAQVADRLEVSSRNVLLSEIGGMVTITARVLDAGGTEIQGAELAWTSENPAVASVDDQGVVTARAEGDTRITVSSGDLSASVAVTVAIEGQTNRFVVTPRSINMASIGETVQLSVRVLDGNAMEIPDPDLIWTSGDPAVASVDGQGLVTAQKNGQTHVTVSWEDLSASVSVTVEQRAVFVGAAPRTVYLDAAGETEALWGAVFDDNGYEIPGAVLTWTSEDPAVATVDDQGVVTARMEGVTRVTATYGDLSDSVMVIVGTPTTLVVNTKSVRLTAIGETVYPDVKLLDAYGMEIFGPGAALVWDSEDPAVASVDDSGGITARMNGQTIVTVTSKDMSDSISVTVAQEPDHIVVTPGSVQLSDGESVQLTAEVFDANNFEIPRAEVNWSSDYPSVASVDDRGLVTAHMTGETNVTVSSSSASTTVVVSVGEVSSDRSALVHFYHALDGPNWKNNTNWLTNEPLENWHGISVNSAGHVVRIRLFDNDLKGDLSASVASLSHLEVLSLSDSLLTGTIPDELGDLESLERITLTFSKISGSIPSSLSRLPRLAVLDLQYNQLTGGIPSSLGNLSSLAYLRLTGNPLGGSIPSSLGRLDKLQRLYLSGAGLTGPIPSSFGGLTSLIELFMAGNFLTGRIPEELGNLEDFISLRLTDNAGLTGPLPRSFLNLEFQSLYLFGTNVCIPVDEEFQEWRSSFHTIYALNCEPDPN